MITTYSLYKFVKDYLLLIPLRGEWNIYVKEGDSVKPGDLLFETLDRKVIQSFYLPQELGIKAKDAADYVCRVDGEFVMPNEILAERVVAGGLSIKTLYSDKEGIIDYSRLNQGFIDILSEGKNEKEFALFDGIIEKIDKKLGIYIKTDVLETRKFYFSEFEKNIKFLDIDTLSGRLSFVGDGSSVYSVKNLTERYDGEIVWAGRFIYPALASAILERGAIAVLAYAMDYKDFEKIDFPLVITGGFGHLPMSSLYLHFWKSLQGSYIKLNAVNHNLIVAGRSVTLYSNPYRKCEVAFKIGDKVRCLDVNHWGEVGLVADVLDNSVTVKLEKGTSLIPEVLLQKFVS